MKALAGFVKATLTGGVLFLFPLIVMVIIIGKAYGIAAHIVAPIVGLMPVNLAGRVVLAKSLAGIVIVLFCFLAGLAWKVGRARRGVEWLERTILRYVPGYDFLKGMSESLMGFETGHLQPVVLARIEEAWQIGFLMEPLENGYFAVFVPGAPSVWSGSVYFMTEDRFTRLDIHRAEALKCLRRLGIGANKMLGTGIPR